MKFTIAPRMAPVKAVARREKENMKGQLDGGGRRVLVLKGRGGEWKKLEIIDLGEALPSGVEKSIPTGVCWWESNGTGRGLRGINITN